MRSSALVPFVSLLVACSAPEPKRPATPTEPVGRTTDGRQTTPVNQTLTPHGTFVELPGLRPQVLARSPDGRWLYTSGKTSELLVLDAATGAVQQRVPLPNDAQQVPPDQRSERELKPDRDGQDRADHELEPPPRREAGGRLIGFGETRFCHRGRSMPCSAAAGRQHRTACASRHQLDPAATRGQPSADDRKGCNTTMIE